MRPFVWNRRFVHNQWKPLIKGYKKVRSLEWVVGVYPKMPSIYSDDLASMIKVLLQVNPKKRPSCDDLLKLPMIRKKIQEFQLDEDLEKNSLAIGGLSGTIQVPKNLKILRDKLPKPNYRRYAFVVSTTSLETKKKNRHSHMCKKTRA